MKKTWKIKDVERTLDLLDASYVYEEIRPLPPSGRERRYNRGDNISIKIKYTMPSFGPIDFSATGKELELKELESLLIANKLI